MKVDIEKLLLALGIKAKRNGREWQALCPLPGHADTKASWSIRDQEGHESHGLHHCFSCNQGGGVLSLTVDVLGFDDRDQARDWLQQNGITSMPDIPQELDHVERSRDWLQQQELAVPAGVRFGNVETWVSAARDYALSPRPLGRGIAAFQVQRWGLGYAVDGRLGGRLFIPTRDEHGRLLSYTARTYRDHDARYLNPRKEEDASTDAIFGAERWGPVATRDGLVLCEGALNALAVERALWTEPAAPLAIGALGGSNVTPMVLATLSTFKRVLVLTDPDAAGDTAAMKVLAALGRWRDVVRVRLPPGGMDIDDLPRIVLQEILAGA
jgi:DNA primase